MVLLRPFEVGDQTAVRNLVLAGLGQRFGTADPTLTPDLDDIQAHYIAGGGTVLVVESAGDGSLIACGVLIPEPNQPEARRMVRISVRADWQGRGLGRLVSLALIEEARQQGVAQVLVETNGDWHSALRLYQSLGFVAVLRTVDETFGYTEVEMVLVLAGGER
jgi:GNAT superfamily N-acetyltransferase